MKPRVFIKGYDARFMFHSPSEDLLTDIVRETKKKSKELNERINQSPEILEALIFYLYHDRTKLYR